MSDNARLLQMKATERIIKKLANVYSIIINGDIGFIGVSGAYGVTKRKPDTISYTIEYFPIGLVQKAVFGFFSTVTQEDTWILHKKVKEFLNIEFRMDKNEGSPTGGAEDIDKLWAFLEKVHDNNCDNVFENTTKAQANRLKALVKKYITKLAKKFELAPGEVVITEGGRWRSTTDSDEIVDLVVLADMGVTRTDLSEILDLPGGIGGDYEHDPDFTSLDEMVKYWSHLYNRYFPDGDVQETTTYTGEFKVGDHVICVNDEGSPLINGKEYIVISLGEEGYIGIKSLDGNFQDEGWYSRRFKKKDEALTCNGDALNCIESLMRFFDFEEEDIRAVEGREMQMYNETGWSYVIRGSPIPLGLERGNLENLIYTFLFTVEQRASFEYNDGGYRPTIREGFTTKLNKSAHTPYGKMKWVDDYWKVLCKAVKLQYEEGKTAPVTVATFFTEGVWATKPFIIKDGKMEAVV